MKYTIKRENELFNVTDISTGKSLEHLSGFLLGNKVSTMLQIIFEEVEAIISNKNDKYEMGFDAYSVQIDKMNTKIEFDYSVDPNYNSDQLLTSDFYQILKTAIKMKSE